MERPERNRDGVRGDLTFFLAHTVFTSLVHARNRSRRVCFGRGAGGSALPARRSHDKTRFFLPHTRRAASQSRMPATRRTQACVTGSALSPGQVCRNYMYSAAWKAGSVTTAMMKPSSALDKGAALPAASAAKGACSVQPCRSRRLRRLLRNTSSPPIVHVAVLPDRRENRTRLPCTFHLPVPSPTASDQDARVSS